jgi:CRISPR-associated protein Cas1
MIAMAQLYVTDHQARIGVDNGRIKVEYVDGLLRTLPIESVEGITIMGNAQVTTNCIGECLRRGIHIQYYSSKGLYYGKLSSTQHVNTKRQRAQITLTEDKEFSLALAKIILKAKINNQIVLLRRYRKKTNIEAEEQIRLMKILHYKVDKATTIAEATGYEGSAARAYFKGLNLVVNVPGFNFTGRNRKPPRDRFNSMLSLGYALVMNDVYGAIEGRGLNPYFGFIHQDKEKHPTLASDLMEEWRAVIVDSVVMSLINGHEIAAKNFYFDEETKGVFFDKKGLKIFLTKIEKRLNTSTKYLSYLDYSVSFRKGIDMQALQLCKAIEEKSPELYQPVLIR